MINKINEDAMKADRTNVAVVGTDQVRYGALTASKSKAEAKTAGKGSRSAVKKVEDLEEVKSKGKRNRAHKELENDSEEEADEDDESEDGDFSSEEGSSYKEGGKRASKRVKLDDSTSKVVPIRET